MIRRGLLFEYSIGRLTNRTVFSISWAVGDIPGFGVSLHFDNETPFHFGLTLWRTHIYVQLLGLN